MKTLLWVVGVIALQVLLVGGYLAVVERTWVASEARGTWRGWVDAVLVAMWLGFVTLIEYHHPPNVA